MAVVWLTGNSGTGKSTVCGVLRARGYVALDADEDGFSRWIDRASGEVVMDPPYPVPGGWLDRYGWAIVRERVETLVEESRFRITFLCGSAENEADIRDLFDVVVCLVIDEDTLRHRLATRTTNPFGQHPEELAAALKWNPRMRAIYESLGATIIDASKPLTEVVDSLIDAVQELSGGALVDVCCALSGGVSGGRVSSGGHGRGWMNKPGWVPTRIPRSVSRLSFRRVLLIVGRDLHVHRLDHLPRPQTAPRPRRTPP